MWVVNERRRYNSAVLHFNHCGSKTKNFQLEFLPRRQKPHWVDINGKKPIFRRILFDLFFGVSVSKTLISENLSFNPAVVDLQPSWLTFSADTITTSTAKDHFSQWWNKKKKKCDTQPAVCVCVCETAQRVHTDSLVNNHNFVIQNWNFSTDFNPNDWWISLSFCWFFFVSTNLHHRKHQKNNFL